MTRHVIVIGAGIVGASTAIWLLRAGLRVTVIDRIGWGGATSHGNGGVLAAAAMVPVTVPGLTRKAPSMVFDPDAPLFLRWRYLPRLLPWLTKYLSFANDAATRRIASGLAPIVTDAIAQHRALAQGTAAATWLADSDYSYAYRSRADFDADAYAWDLRAQHGFVPVLREGEAARTYAPNLAEDITCIATLKDHGFVLDPGGYVQALGKEVETLGGAFLQASVHDFELVGGTFRAVLTDKGPVAGDAAVLTTGVWSKPLMQRLGIKVPLETERGYHIIFKGARDGPDHPMMLAAGKFVATPMRDGVRCAGILEFGGLEAGPSKAPFDFLRRHTKAAFPNMTWEDEVEWQGHRPAPADSLPLIGEVRASRIFTGFGHHHIGLTGGPKTGRLLAQLIGGAMPNLDLTPYAPARFA
ncbi:FAD-binding oxidoreductase [Tateyamaria sp. syn59]|uniref:NAD(P)/FAD-dependent oxidoreductase n=1 Tax=Tateyamaria sp. syn59 TaxID=2576942 RepID=UPI0011BDC72A|nr:FAD-dependent oxidoreductase [Tateyamaria sp. syn59]